MGLCRLLYCSQALPDLGYPELKDIMEASERNNAPVGITGILCFRDSQFLQMLEGDRQAVSHTYQRIAGDRRHYNSQLIDFSEVEMRVFGVWSMKVLQLGSYQPEEVASLQLKYSGAPQFAPAQMSAAQCLHFLQELGALYQLSQV